MSHYAILIAVPSASLPSIDILHVYRPKALLPKIKREDVYLLILTSAVALIAPKIPIMVQASNDTCIAVGLILAALAVT